MKLLIVVGLLLALSVQLISAEPGWCWSTVDCGPRYHCEFFRCYSYRMNSRPYRLSNQAEDPDTISVEVEDPSPSPKKIPGNDGSHGNCPPNFIC